jgi:aspartate/methionine/tyrosine aminotransferase
LAKNPSLQGKSFSTPIVTAGVTHALTLMADLFMDPGDIVLLPDKFWENYDLQFRVRFGAQFSNYSFFSEDGGFNVPAFRQALAARNGAGKTIVSLNFPNNPTGYSITETEADQAVAALLEAADAGNDMVVVTDDAYFGLFYEEGVLQESMFARLADLHERILAVKVDGPTKEQFVWGFRTGMLTFSTKAPDGDALYQALERKVAGAVRSAISNCAHPSQSILVRAMAGEELEAEKQEKKSVLQARAKKVAQILSSSEFDDVWEAYPFNAGYFMCLRLKNVNCETFRQHLLEKYGIGVISDGEYDIRVAFSSVEESELESLYQTMATAARELVG